MASKEFEDLLEVIVAGSEGPFFEIPLEQTRARLDAVGMVFPLPEGTRVEKLTVAGRPAEWISAPGSNPSRAILYLHGGGYCSGSLASHRGMAGFISQFASARVLLLDYRLAPEHPFPAAVEDALAAYEWLLGSIEAAKIVLGGDSAGGGLTVSTLVSLRERGLPIPACAFVISPWTDLELTGESFSNRAEADPFISQTGLKLCVDRYLGGRDPRDPKASPIHADLSGLPPLLIHVGDAETLLDDSVVLARRAESAGVDVTLEIWPDMVHIWHVFGTAVPESAQALSRVGDFVRRHVP